MSSRLRLVPGVAAALRASRRLEAHEHWDAERLRAYQRRRLLELVRHAAANSPYYRERFAGIELSDDLDLAALPTLDKGTMVEHFDEVVTDRRLNLGAVEGHVSDLGETGARTDAKLLGEYRVLASGGTSGRRGLFVYGRGDWAEILAGLARYASAYLDFSPKLPRRRYASIVAEHPLHISGRLNRSLDVGAHRTLRLDARAPLGELVEALNGFRPEHIVTYPSLAAQLAERQLGGELRVAPRLVSTSGEVRTEEMRRRIAAAWGRDPFNIYVSTETGYMAGECDRHEGLHVFEDQVQIEVVDDAYRPVPDGETGTRLLVTNLTNRTQPLIRYELDDMVTAATRRCSCSRPFPLLRSVGGRREDVLKLPGAAGGSVAVHPVALHSPLEALATVSTYRIFHHDGGLGVEVVLNGEGAAKTCAEVEVRLRAALAAHGAQVPAIRVESVEEIPRHANSGKHRAIEVTPA